MYKRPEDKLPKRKIMREKYDHKLLLSLKNPEITKIYINNCSIIKIYLFMKKYSYAMFVYIHL
jgi:hypothetical protein